MSADANRDRRLKIGWRYEAETKSTQFEGGREREGKGRKQRGTKRRTWAGDPVAVRVPIQEALVGKRLEVDGTLKKGRIGRRERGR